MRLSILMTGILVTGAVALAACGGDSDDTVVAEPTEAPAATQVSAGTTAATAAPTGSSDIVEVPAHFEGTGSLSTGQFNLKSGPVDFTISHDGAEEFVVLLYSGENLASIVVGTAYSPVTGAFDDTKTLRLIVAGSPVHYLQITADGNWTVDVSQ